jgi:pyruvate/2-oxoglutarate dehydrogenase complex dihydrolipoamide dehydrogenase (E3) component
LSERFEAIVIGGGPAGEVAVERLARAGLGVALVERELVGGECAYWACIPSKTLLRPAEVRSEARRAAGLSEPRWDWAEIAAYRDYMVRKLDDREAVEAYERSGVTVVKGEGRVVGPGTVEAGERTLESERIVIATGSDSAIPPIEGLEEAGYWTNREATTLAELPESAIVLGGGPVGIELGQMLSRYGTRVTIVESSQRLLPREDPGVGARIASALEQEGIELRLGVEATGVERKGGPRRVSLGEAAELEADELLVAVGRSPRIDGLGVERAGIEPSKKGIEVDARCRAGEGIWAVGDVTGVMPFTHVAKYQGRLAVRDMLGERVEAHYEGVPRVVFSDPEVAAAGLTAAEAGERGIELEESCVELSDVARTETYGKELDGALNLLVDRERKVLAGAWAVGPLAGEWIHHASLAIRAEVPLDVLRDAVPQFPTFSELYQKAYEQLKL